jgi:hypothetical protein
MTAANGMDPGNIDAAISKFAGTSGMDGFAGLVGVQDPIYHA